MPQPRLDKARILQTLHLFVHNMVFIYLSIQINYPILNENVSRVMDKIHLGEKQLKPSTRT